MTSSSVQSTDGWWRRVVLQQLRHLSCVSNQDDTATISRAHQSLSKELATDNTVSVYIKPQSNSIHRLPPELIVRCFRWLVDLEPPARSEWSPCYNKNKNHRTKATLGWLKITHVCKFWRDIAIQDSLLWRTPTFDIGAECAELMISRSKSALLHISCPILDFGRECGKLIPLIGDHLSRTETLHVHGPDVDIYTLVTIALSRPAPVLHRLSLSASRTRSLDPKLLTFPGSSKLFDDYAPSLAEIHLEGGGLPFPRHSPIFDNVTFLSVHFPRDPPSYKELRALLEAMHNLEALELQKTLEDVHGNDVRIRLPKLQSLTLSDTPKLSHDFLQAIETSTSLLRVRLKVAYDNSDSMREAERVSILADLIFTRYLSSQRGRSTVWMRTGSSSNDETVDIAITGSSWSASDVDVPASNDGCDLKSTTMAVLFAIPSLHRDGFCPGACHSIYRSFSRNFSDVEDLIVDSGRDEYTAPTLTRLIHEIPSLRRLSFRNGPLPLSYDGFRHLLCPERKETTPPTVLRPEDDVCSPYLTTLAILGPSLSYPKGIEAFQDDLLGTLKERKVRFPGCMLKEIVLGSSVEVREQFLEDLRNTGFSVKIVDDRKALQGEQDT